MEKTMDEMLKVADAAIYLQVSKALLYAMIQRKEIPHIRLSERRVVIRRSDLEKWLEKKTIREKTHMGFI